MHLIARLPKDRYKPGLLTAYNGAEVLGSWQVLGKADNAMATAKGNPTRNPIKPFGDTPTGRWKVSIGRKCADTATYGPEPVFWLWPLDGQAYTSYSPVNRRSGIWLHGGDPNPAGGLRPTYGCLRVTNDAMRELNALADKFGVEYLIVEEIA